MRLEKKLILKEDGRYLVFYHSAESASEEQSKAFAEVAAEATPMSAPTAQETGATVNEPSANGRGSAGNKGAANV